MSNSFNEDYNTYLLEKSILETSKPPINNIETTENIEEIENIEVKPEKSIEDTLLEFENTNDLLQGGNNKIIGGGSGSYTVNGNYTINSSASNGIFGLEITPHIHIPTPANPSPNISAAPKNKLQFIQMCNNIKEIIFENNPGKWEYIMNNYLVNLLEKNDSNIELPKQILTIITAINTKQVTTTTTTYNIDLSQIKLKSDLNTEAKIINNINNLLLKIPYKYFLTDLTLFTSNNKEIRWFTGIILIILFGICIYKLNLSNYDLLSNFNSLTLQISKWVLFSIISILILFMEIGGKLFDEFSIDGLTINNDITMSFIYISLIILIYGIFNYINKTDDSEILNAFMIAITISISIGIIWIGNTIFYKIFPNEEAQKKQLKDILNQQEYYKTYNKKTQKSDNWVQYSFPVMIFLYICTFIYFLNKKPLFIQEQSNLFILFSFITSIILGVIYFITNKNIYIYNLLGSTGIIAILLSILILIYKFVNNSGLEAPKIGYNYLLDIIPIYLLLVSSITNISTLNINQLVIGASIEVIIRLFIIAYIMIGVSNLTKKDGYLSYHIFILLGCFTMILLSNSDNKIMKIEEFNVSYSVISPFMNLLYFMYIVN